MAANTLASQGAAEEIIASSLVRLGRGEGSQPVQVPLGEQSVLVVNTLAFARSDMAELTLATDPSTSQIEVTDAQGKRVPAQVIVKRRYLPESVLKQLSEAREVAPGKGSEPTGGGINTATVLIAAKAPSMGYVSYRVKPLYGGQATVPTTHTFARSEADGTVTIENDLYRLKIDPQKGGAITGLLVKSSAKEFCSTDSERLFNEYRGYFIAQKAWLSSTGQPAQVILVETGPLRATVMVRGKIGDVPFVTHISLAEGQRRIDFAVRFVYDQDTWIGDPWEMPQEDRRTEPRRSQNDGRWKLQAYFPTAFQQDSIYKNAAFDVCRSRNANTFFQRWDEIKHNILVNWVDAVDGEGRFGLAVLSDHTTAYTHGPSHPLALVLGWAWEGGFWWGKHALRGEQQIRYGIIPHEGLWDRAGISRELGCFSEPLLTQLMTGEPSRPDFSLVAVNHPGVEISTMVMEREHLLVRLWNAESGEEEHTVLFGKQPTRVELVELDGRVVRELAVREGDDNNPTQGPSRALNPPQNSAPGHRAAVTLPIPRFGIRTLRCSFAGKM